MKIKQFLPLLAMGSFLTLMSNDKEVLASSSYGGGSGTQSDPYLISTPQHLNQLRLDVNVNGIDTSGKYYRLTQNIDLSGYDNDSNETNGNFTPIRTAVVPFKGHFEGDGHVISNLKIVLPSKQYVGLFGHIDSATVQKVGLENISLEGYYYVGGIAGKQTDGSISQSYTTGSIVNNGNDTGGLVGTQSDDGRISQSYSTASVSSTGFYTGGLVGNQNFGGITKCYATGKVSGSDAGGLTGNTLSRASGGSTKVPKPSLGTVLDSYWDTQTTNSSNSGGGVGLTTAEMTGESAKINMSGFDFDAVWKTTDSYPKLQWQPEEIIESTDTVKDVTVNGIIQTMVADVTIPAVSPDLIINPNLTEGFVTPEFSVLNESVSPIKLELKAFEQVTDSFNDVLPTKYDTWIGLNKTQSKDIALSLIAKEGEGWQILLAPTSYVANHAEHEIGIIKPTSSVDFSFDVKHGTSFSEAKKVQYKMVFVFDLMN